MILIAQLFIALFGCRRPVRDAMKTCRAKKGLTMATFLDAAITTELSALVTSLAALGISSNDQTRPARLPMNDELLMKLKVASASAGLPAQTLLIACLRLSAARKRAKKG